MSVTESRAEQRLLAALRATADVVASDTGLAHAFPGSTGDSTFAVQAPSGEALGADEIPIQLLPASSRGLARDRPGGQWARLAAGAAVACAITGIVLALALSGSSGTSPVGPAGGSGGSAGVPVATSSAAAASSTASGSASGPETAASSSPALGETSSAWSSPSCGYATACASTVASGGSAQNSPRGPAAGGAGPTGSTP